MIKFNKISYFILLFIAIFYFLGVLSGSNFASLAFYLGYRVDNIIFQIILILYLINGATFFAEVNRNKIIIANIINVMFILVYLFFQVYYEIFYNFLN